MAITGTWKFKDTSDPNKRAEYLKSLSHIILTSQSMAEDLATLEYLEREEVKKKVTSRIEQVIIELELLRLNL